LEGCFVRDVPKTRAISHCNALLYQAQVPGEAMLLRLALGKLYYTKDIKEHIP